MKASARVEINASAVTSANVAVRIIYRNVLFIVINSTMRSLFLSITFINASHYILYLVNIAICTIDSIQLIF